MTSPFKDMQEYQKTRRQPRLSQFEHDKELIKNSVYVEHLIMYTEYHCGIKLQQDKGIIQYWPTAAKWSYNKKFGNGNFSNLLEFITKVMRV